MTKIHISDVNSGNNLFESRMLELRDSVKYTTEYLLNHLILTPDFVSPNAITFKLQDGNHAFSEYIRRFPDLDIVDIPVACFRCSERLLDKYEDKCL